MMEKYEIYDAVVPFDDASDEKERPVLVVVVLEDKVTALKISTKPRTGETQFPIKEWEKAGLSSESYIYYEPVYIFQKKDLGTYRGKLQIADIFNLEQKFYKL